MARGDHLEASRSGYHHDGIDLGDGRVVHYAADEDGAKDTARVRITSLEEFAGDGVVTVRPYARGHDPERTVARALSRVGESRYNLLVNNCEHFARWCVTGSHRSEQVVAASTLAAVAAVPCMAAQAGIGVVGSVGVVGLSGAGMMSGLASVGALVGGGAVAGLAVLGGAPALISASVIAHYAFPDDLALDDGERRARTVGRLGAVAGGVVGLAGVTLAMSGLGTAGLGAAGISSGLATLGSLAGGGMATGILVGVAVPAIGVALGALLLYGLWSWLEAREAAFGPPGQPPALGTPA